MSFSAAITPATWAFYFLRNQHQSTLSCVQMSDSLVDIDIIFNTSQTVYAFFALKQIINGNQY